MSELRRFFLVICGLLVCVASLLARQSPLPQGKKQLPVAVLYGYVFDQNGRLFQYAEVRVRHVSDKKPKWETTSDREGEFAVHVPSGDEYVVEVKAKGYLTQSQTVTAQAYTRVDMVFHMEPAPGKSK